MLKATVTGRIWSTKKLSEVPAGSILEVLVDETSSRLLAFDPLGCGEGEKVIIATGSVAAGWFPGKSPPIDALIIGSISRSRTATRWSFPERMACWSCRFFNDTASNIARKFESRNSPKDIRHLSPTCDKVSINVTPVAASVT